MTKKSKSYLATHNVMAGVCLAAMVCVLPISAHAQGAELNENSLQLQDIVVTAQRRAETAQSVPVSITAVSGAELEAAAISKMEDLTQGIVGVTYAGNSTSTPELYIRGIGTNRRDIGSDPSSGVYIDEVYQPRFANVIGDLVDIERIEVLRGPQGTLFGRNTIGGAIAVHTAQPSRSLEGRITATVGNMDYYSVGGTVSGPLSERLRARISGGYADRTGFMKDTVSGIDNGTRNYTIRGKIAYDLTDDVEFLLSGSYFNSKQKGSFLDAGNTPLFLAGPLKPQILDNDPYSGAYTIPGGNHIRQGQVGGKLEWKGDALNLTALAGWISYTLDASEDLDANINDNIDYLGHAHSDTYSAELRLASTDGGALTLDDKLEWVTGVYFFRDDGEERAQFTAGLDSPIAFLLANPGLLVNPMLPPPYNPPAFRKSDQTNIASELTSVAVYGQGTYSFTDQLSLTLGARYTHDSRDYVFTSINGLPGVPFPFVPFDFVEPGKLTSSSFTPKIGLEFKPDRDVLLYASYSKGFKAAAIQSTATQVALARQTVDPEKVQAYEIGMKSEFFNRRVRLNLSGFINKFEDLQVRRVVVFPGGFSTAIIQNAASSTIKGVEVEASALVMPGLRINGSYSYLDATYGTYIADPGNPTATPPVPATVYSGNEMVRAPKNRFNIDAVYTTSIMGDTELELRAAYNYTGTFFFQPDNSVLSKEKGYGLTDVSARVTLPNGTTSLQLWGRNIFDVEYRSYNSVLDQENRNGYGDKATYGVTVAQRF